MMWRVNFVRSKDAQKQLARTSLSKHLGRSWGCLLNRVFTVFMVQCMCLYLAIWSSSSSCCFLILGGAGLALLGLGMLRLLKRKGIISYYSKSSTEQQNHALIYETKQILSLFMDTSLHQYYCSGNTLKQSTDTLEYIKHETQSFIWKISKHWEESCK